MFVPKSKRQAGFSMIEVLVTIVILSLGLLGLAALQTRGQQFNHSANIRTHATMLAYDIMEKIRINKTFAKSDVLASTGIGKGYVVNSKPANIPDCIAGACSVEQMRNYDLGQWYDRLAVTLPQGTGQISADNSLNPIIRYTITIRWALRDNEQDVGVETTHRSLSWMVQL